MKTFEIKEEHLTLLQNAYVGWESCEFGAPAINCKRPYGNNYVEGDIAEILKWKVDEDGELTDEQYELAEKLHKETQTALQICLVMKEFKTGVFRQADAYRNRAWERVQ